MAMWARYWPRRALWSQPSSQTPTMRHPLTARNPPRRTARIPRQPQRPPSHLAPRTASQHIPSPMAFSHRPTDPHAAPHPAARSLSLSFPTPHPNTPAGVWGRSHAMQKLPHLTLQTTPRHFMDRLVTLWTLAMVSHATWAQSLGGLS